VTTGLEHALELSEKTATLYLTGELTPADAFRLRGVCREIPERVRVLRVDVQGVVRIDVGALATIRAVVRYWKHSRGGSFRLSIASEHLVATLSNDAPVNAPATGALFDAPRKAALMGVFL
jgi:ABC-type transporter Mla MlaB component